MTSFTSSKLLLIGTALLGLVHSSVLPVDNLFSRQSTSLDGTCGVVESGAGHGYKCPPSTNKCCSQWGWCGDSTDYCGTGCQPGYGSCTGSGGTPTPISTPTPNPTATPTPTSTSTPTPTPPGGTGGRPQLGNVPYGQIISSCTQEGVVALTFDDGPYIYTSPLLDILASNGVKATFFVNGHNWGDPITSPENSASIQRMIANGHQVGSHTWSHPSLDTLSAADITSQMTQLETAFMSIIGKYPTYMRPPYFECGGSCLGVLGGLSYHVIFANLDTLDWAYTANIQVSEDKFSSAISSSDAASSNWIVLAHDVHPTTVNSLVQHMIDTLTAKGYRTVTIGECLGDPAANWYRT